MSLIKNRIYAGLFPLSACFLLAAALPVLAQTAGSIGGVVQDAQGAVVPGAKVALTNTAQGTGAQAVTSAEGAYFFTPVQAGTYNLTVEAGGFKKYNQSGITVNAGDKLGLAPIALEVGAATESVTIEANAVQLETVTAERAGVVDGKQIIDIALNGRNFNSLIRTVPGALADGTLSINGQRTDQGNFTVDGQSVNDTGVNVTTGFGYRLSVDAIAEFKVSANSMGAEFGRNSGAQIQVVTKGGTRDFHGTGYWFKRGEFMNANTFVNNASPVSNPLVNNGAPTPQFPIYRFLTLGYNIGGPVFIPGKFNKDRQKLFFFVSQEWNRQTVGNTPRQITVPTALERQGNFSLTHDGSGIFVPIKDPAAGGAPFAGNIVPPTRFNQFGTAILNFMPLPNISGNNTFNYQSQAPSITPQFDEVYRVDYNITDRWHMFFRSLRSHSTQVVPYGRGDSSNALALSQLTAPTFAWPNFTVNLTTVISPTLTNEFQYGYTKNGIPGDAPPAGSPYYASVSNLNIPLLYPNADPSHLVPNFGFGGVPGPNFLAGTQLSAFNGMPYANQNPVHDITDNLVKVYGNHTIKAGLFIERAMKSESAFGDVNSTISFARDSLNPGDTNWAFSNALLGNFASYTQFSKYPIVFMPYVNTEFYGQDSWKVNKKLTVNFGIRFASIPPMTEYTDQIANFLPSAFDPAKAVRLFQPALIGGQRVAYDAATKQSLNPAYIGFIVPGSGDVNNGNVQAGVGGTPRGLMQNRGLHIGPRIGLAYAPNSKTVVRIGFGAFFERIVAGLSRTQATDPPFVRQPQLLYGNISNIAASASVQSPVGVSGISPDGHVPTVYNFSFGVQRELPAKFLLDVSYVGSVSRHLVMLVPVNDVPFGSAWLPQNQDPTAAAPKFDGTTTVPVNLYRPFPGYVGPSTSSFSNYGYVDNFGGSSNYNALQVAVNRRVSSFSFGMQYSWSKALGINSMGTSGNSPGSCSFGAGPCGVTPGNLRNIDYGPLSFDRSQQMTFNYLWNIPGGARLSSHLDNAAGRAVLNNWQLSGLTSISKGAPINVTYNVTGVGAALLNRETTGSEDVAPRVVLTCNPNVGGPITAFINTSCFAPAPLKGSVGADSGINRVRGPGLNNWDMSLFKKFQLGKEASRFVQLRLEAYNAPNAVEWATINSTATFASTTSNQITNLPSATNRFGFGAKNSIRANSQRILQVAVKIYF